MWSGDRLEAVVPIRIVYTFTRFNGYLDKVNGIWVEHEWIGRSDGLTGRNKGKGRFKMAPEFLAFRIE